MQARTLTALTVAVILLVATSYARAADNSPAKSSTVTISVAGMHCAGCAKKVETKLKTIAGVDQVKIDVAKGTVVVNPRAKKELSPRLLWGNRREGGLPADQDCRACGNFNGKAEVVAQSDTHR